MRRASADPARARPVWPHHGGRLDHDVTGEFGGDRDEAVIPHLHAGNAPSERCTEEPNQLFGVPRRGCRVPSVCLARPLERVSQRLDHRAGCRRGVQVPRAAESLLYASPDLSSAFSQRLDHRAGCRRGVQVPRHPFAIVGPRRRNQVASPEERRQGLDVAQAMGTLTKHGVKQVDRLLSNRGLNVWAFFAYWTPFIVGARTEVVVALDWTSFAADGQDTIVLSMLTGHGRATPLLWKTVASSTLKGNQRRYEYELLCRLREVLPAGVKVTVVADRGFADCKLFYALTTELAFEYVIRLRGDIYVTNARGERRAAAAWVGAGGRAQRLVGARVTDTYELAVGVVVCVQDPKMDEPWCLVASEATVPTRVLIRYYGKRWGIEAGFRDIKDMRFGMGLSSMHVSRPDRRDRLLLISALAIAVLSLLGAAGEHIGYDRWLKANTVKRRTHSLFRQGLMLYHHLPNWPEDRIRPLMETFGNMLMEQRVYREVFGVI